MAEKNEQHIDPVCSMTVTEQDAASSSSFEGKKYYFCSTDCKDQFELLPERYAESVVPKP